MSSKSFAVPKRLVIATRESRLALWQARHVQALLKNAYPECEVELLGMTTQGDQILDKSLSKIGGKGLFVKELQMALLDGRADFAVHSLKDVPVEPQEHFSLVAILEREDPRDALVSNHYSSLDDLPINAVVGTSSLRREAQLRAHYPHLVIKPLRGNLDTRLAKLDAGDYDTIVLASAGLKRLGLADRIRSHIDVERSLPAVGQGALGIEALSQREDLAQVLQVLNDPVTALTSQMERAVSKALGGSCQVPLAAYAQIHDQTVRLRTLVAQPDGEKVLRTDHQAPCNEADSLVERAITELESQGAKAIIQSLLS